MHADSEYTYFYNEATLRSNASSKTDEGSRVPTLTRRRILQTPQGDQQTGQHQGITHEADMSCKCSIPHCKNKGGQSPPICLCQHTNCPFGVLWETKWWALPTFVFTV